MKQLADYVQTMQTDDVLAATDKAKVQARTLLEDQDITSLARRLLGAGRRFAPDRDAVAELVAERAEEDQSLGAFSEQT